MQHTLDIWFETAYKLQKSHMNCEEDQNSIINAQNGYSSMKITKWPLSLSA